MNNRLFTPSPIHLFLFFLSCHLTVHMISGYEPSYSVALNCGSRVASTGLGSRPWQGDEESTFISAAKQRRNASFIAEALQQQSVDRTPYMTARVFRSPFTYVFDNVPPGPKYIRLHFYPALYNPQFDASKVFFSVTVGSHYTLLSNFSAFLTARYSKEEAAFFKEFCINLPEGQRLNVTFIPSSEKADGYAFINGIEIVSMPEYLYYSVSNDISVPIVGQDHAGMPIDKTLAMEAVYRLNVGGQHISPMGDTGMFRTWFQDDDYLVYRGADPVNATIAIQYSDQFPNYSAPELVYQTARSMGRFKATNMRNNLTWRLPLDLGFNYLIRLHFCEFSPKITKKQDREFHIFINQQTVESQADVITWSGGNGRAMFKNYVVIWQNWSQRMDNLTVELHPNGDSRTAYSDVILNGLELFKLSDASHNLAGPNPEAITDPAPLEPGSRPTESRQKSRRPAIAIAGSVLGGVFLLSMLGFLFHRRRKTTNTTTTANIKASSLPSDLCRRFTLSEIKTATNDFDIILRIGAGGFGNVYKGYIDGNATKVAIKRLNPNSKQGVREFQTEIEMLSMLRHVHLVSLIGFCSEDHEMILVYEYMANGTLSDHLYGKNNPPLPWKQRLKICLSAARGLHYLHTGATHTVIHRDVKTTNILLDDKWVAKVSDFGLSKVGPTSMSESHVSTAVKGTLGYLDPEYFRLRQLTEKSDVYSFGVVLFEVLSARPAVVKSEDKDRVSLAVWGPRCFQEGTLYQMVDPLLKGEIALECLNKFGEMATNCLHRDGIERPSMSDVIWGLEFALQLQETAEKIEMEGGKENDEALLSYPNTDRVDESSGQASGSRSSTVFTMESIDTDHLQSVFSLVKSHSGR